MVRQYRSDLDIVPIASYEPVSGGVSGGVVDIMYIIR